MLARRFKKGYYLLLMKADQYFNR